MKPFATENRLRASLKAAALAALTAVSVTAFSFLSFAGEPIVITYDNLRDLLIAGNQSVKDALDNYSDSIDNNREIVAVLNSELEEMKFLEEHYKDEEGAEDSYQTYRSNANNLSSVINRLNRQITSATSPQRFLSTEKTIDSYEMSAQTLLNSYNQMLCSYNTQAKTTEAAEQTYETALLKFQAGSGTQEEVDSAGNSLLSAQNQLESYRIRLQSAKESLLMMLGIDTGADVIIGTVPEPDIAAILSIDFASDVETAVGNNSQVQSARHTNAYTDTDRDAKSRSETLAEGTVRTDLSDAYEQLMAYYLDYEAACQAYEAAEMNYGALQRQRQAGMLTDAEYASGEASWLQAVASKETAAMNLKHAYDSYNWEVKGV